MQSFFTPLGIFLATSSGFLVGALWYSPLLFMKAWLYGEGVTKESIPKRTPLYLAQTMGYSFIAHGALALVLAVLLDVLSVATLKVAVSLGLLMTFGFIVTTRFIDMVYTVEGKHWERRSQIKFLVSAGYYLVSVAVMTVVLFTVGAR
jgi:hypothetical protein